MEEQETPADNASQLQEAIDTIIQTFDHPKTLSIEYTLDRGIKRTTFQISTSEKEEVIYELSYDGQRDETEPKIAHLK